MGRESERQEDSSYRVLARAVYLAAGLVALGWFLHEAGEFLLLFMLALILALSLNPPVNWLQAHRLSRGAATLLVCAMVALVLALLGWLVIPQVVEELRLLAVNLPSYATQLAHRLSFLLGHYPGLEQRLRLDSEVMARMTPTLPVLLGQIGHYSVSLLGLALAITVLVSLVVFMVANPRPLLRLYLQLFPPRLRDRAARAFARSAVMVDGWMWSNLIVGGMEALAAGIFLTLMDIPGVLVWAVLALFAELIPRLGAYIMALPPFLVALSIGPLTALWVALFYLVLNEFAGNFVGPRVRASTMNLHPVSIIFMMVAMASAFGFLGALISMPVAGFIKAYYEEFYLARYAQDEAMEARIEYMMTPRKRKT